MQNKLKNLNKSTVIFINLFFYKDIIVRYKKFELSIQKKLSE